jgi:apoptosis-inducing factor 2
MGIDAPKTWRVMPRGRQQSNATPGVVRRQRATRSTKRGSRQSNWGGVFLSADVLDEQGFVKLDEILRVVGHPEVFCVGDVYASDPLRSSARNWGWRIVASNVRRHVRHRRRLKRHRAPDFRWGSILGLQRNGLTVVQPNGHTCRIPKRIASYFLYRIFVGRYLYRGLSRD